MEPFLFPSSFPGFTEPLKELFDNLLPSAKQSVLIIDPSPSIECIRVTLLHCGSKIHPRFLGRLDSRPFSATVESRASHPALTMAVLEGSAEFRYLQELSIRLYVIDDTAFMVSGPLDQAIAYGIRLDGNNALQTIEYAENLWKSGRRVTPGRLEEHRRLIQSAISKGELAANDLVTLINDRGAFVQVHTGFYIGFRGIPLPSIPGVVRTADSTTKNEHIADAPRWTFVDSLHFSRLGRLSARMHALSSRAYLKKTPAGMFLLNEDRLRWEHEFESRAEQFRDESMVYTQTHYSEIREGALKRLRRMIDGRIQSLRDEKILLPFSNPEDFMSFYLDKCTLLFPSIETLAGSCRTWFIRFGVHPDSVKDSTMMTLFSEIAFQADTDLDFLHGDPHD